MTELLLANRAEVNARDFNDWTPLHWASHKGYKDEAELLLLNKADVNAKNKWGRPPLREAELQGHESIADFLRRHGGSD